MALMDTALPTKPPAIPFSSPLQASAITAIARSTAPARSGSTGVAVLMVFTLTA